MYEIVRKYKYSIQHILFKTGVLRASYAFVIVSYKLLLLLILLQSCNTTPIIHSTLLPNTVERLKKDYNIDHGHLVVRYDLAKLNETDCLHAKDFGQIINDNEHNELFLQKVKKIKYKNFHKEAAHKVTRIKHLLSKLHNKHKFLSESELHLITKATYKNHIHELSTLDKLVNSIPIMMPQSYASITSHYGIRKHPIRKHKKFHCGTDLTAHMSAPVYSAADGVITSIGKSKGYGNLVEIKHSPKFTTKYAHLKTIFVKEGAHVTRGQLIGLQGNTGHSTREHLHFEIWLNNKHVNPFDFLAHACNC